MARCPTYPHILPKTQRPQPYTVSPVTSMPADIPVVVVVVGVVGVVVGEVVNFVFVGCFVVITIIRLGGPPAKLGCHK